MPTIKQINAVKKMVEHGRNGTMTKGQILREAGYSENTSLAPTKVTESVGFKKELAKYGLTEELITTALVDDIKAKKKKRFNELSLGAELLGMKKKDSLNVNLISLSLEDKTKAIKALDDVE